MSAVEFRAMIRQFSEEVWHKGDLEAIDCFFAPDFISYDPVKPKVVGADQFKTFVKSVRTAFPNIHFTWEDFITCEDKIVGRWTCRGTHLGQSDILGVPATGKRVTFTGITIYQIFGDKFVASWEIWDQLGLIQQLGILPMAVTNRT